MATATKNPGKTYGLKVEAELNAQAAARAQAPKPAATAAPEAAAEPEKVKKPKVKRVPYPGLNFGPDGNVSPEDRLKAWPADYDRKLHQPLRPKDFVNEGHWYMERAERLAVMAVKLREKAELMLKFGTTKQRRKAEKVKRLKETLALLEAQLAEQDAIVTVE